ncbi:MAG: UMP kinase [Rhizobiales bacterium]|nr:UMP kinase [Hyphomicrobiales bacterium]
MKAKPRFKKVLLKLSGEALQGGKQFGIDNSMVTRLAGEIAEAVSLGVRLGLVVGGGNFVRGAQVAREGGNRVAGDQMGMLATVMNSIALNEALVSTGVEARLFSAVPMPTFCETFSQQRAIKAFEAGRVTIFAGGTGNPFFTTDSGAALRAAEMGCDALFKATNVDGIYSADPKKDPKAKRFDRLTHAEVLAKGLAVMDAAAVALARDSHIPVIVFSVLEPGAFVSVLKGAGRSTIVEDA